MSRFFAPIAALSILAVVSAPALAQSAAKIRTFEVRSDVHSSNEASFTSKASIVKFTGRTSHVNGNVRIDVNNVSRADGAMAVDLTTLDTGIGLRNEHLRGTIEAAKYPTATFKVTKIQLPGNKLKANAPATGTVTGQMSLHGVTRTLVAPVVLTYLPQEDANYRAGDWVFVESTFKLKLSDYKIALPAPVMGVKVADELDITFNSMAKAI
jgi:polyisoprenoid-binding protein YceI